MATDESMTDPENDRDVQYVEVTFTGNKCNRIVKVCDVFERKDSASHINPAHDGDFKCNEEYQAKWFCCRSDGRRCEDDHVHKYRLLPAVIHRLGDTHQGILEKSGQGQRQKFKASVYQSQDSRTSTQSLRDVRKESLARKKLMAGVIQKRSYETMAKSLNIIPAKVAKTFNDSCLSDAELSAHENRSVDDLPEQSDHSQSNQDPPLVMPYSTSGIVTRPCSVQLNWVEPHDATAALGENGSQPNLPTGAGQTPRILPPPARDPNLLEDSSDSDNQVEPNPDRLQAITSGRTSIRTHRTSLREAPIADRTRLNPQFGEPGHLQTQAAAANHGGRIVDEEVDVNARRRRSIALAEERLLDRNRNAPVNDLNTVDEPQQEEALMASLIQERMGADGYSCPDSLDYRGQLKRDTRSRRELAITVYELYHKEGGPYYNDRATYRYRVVGQRMHLTRDLDVDLVRYGLINKKGPKKFISTTASMLFKPRELLISALDPTQVKNAIPGYPRPRKICRDRLLLLLSLYHDYVFGKSSLTLEEKEKLLLKGCGYLSRFLCDKRNEKLKKLHAQAEGQDVGRA